MFDGIGDFFTKGIAFWCCVIALTSILMRRAGGLKGIFGDAAADALKKKAKEKALERLWQWLK